MACQDPTFYNIDAGVGAGLPNKMDDVMLVQFFLKEIFALDPTKQPAGPGIAVDGKFGPQTEMWIRAYQNYGKSSGFPIVVDGKVSTVPADYRVRNSMGGRHTITALNRGFAKNYPADFADLSKSGKTPGPLRASLRSGEF